MTLKTLAQAGEEGKNSKILIAVDFGTTYSGIAWAQTARPDVQDCIVQWPDANGSLQGKTQEKVPTELYYDGDEIKWGFQIPEDEARYQWFKLGLDPSQNDEISHLSVEYPDPKALPPGYEHDPVRLSTDYLTCLRKHAINILQLKLGKGVVETTPIEYILTVPAIWDDAAKSRTKACALSAGMGADVRTVTEPEAAVVYALDAMDPHNLTKGDKFVLCDAGGGTVDLITYVIEELTPKVKVREAVAGDGDACGGTFLNRIFGKLLEETFSDDIEWDDELQEEAMKSFESVKREFTGDQKHIVISVNGLSDDAGRGIKRARWTIPANIVKSKFEPVISVITKLVKNQLKAAKTAKAVLLVGGFGGSVYLRKCIERVVGDKIEVMQPANGWTAIVKGALIWGLNDSSPADSRISIASRVARKYYGIQASIPFDSGIHKMGREHYDAFEGKDMIDVWDWIVKQGTDIDQDQAIITRWYRAQRVSSGPFGVATVRLYSFHATHGEEAPVYPCREAKRLVDLSADLSSIAKTFVPIRKGADGLDYYVLDYEIRVKFFSAHTEYSLWYLGVEYGKVNAEYA